MMRPVWSWRLIALVALLSLQLAAQQGATFAEETCNQGRPECDNFRQSCPDSTHHRHDHCCRTGSATDNPDLCDNDCCDDHIGRHVIGIIVGVILFVIIVGAIIYCFYVGAMCFQSREQTFRTDGTSTSGVMPPSTTATSTGGPPYEQPQQPYYPQQQPAPTAPPPEGPPAYDTIQPPVASPANAYPPQTQATPYYPQQQQQQQQQQEQQPYS